MTQTDVVGHSMGGLLTRLYIGGGQFRRPENLGQGDIRRLLTLDTPHQGSTFGNLVAALHRVNPARTDKAVSSITGYLPAGGAVCDLSESSPALQGLNGSTAIRGAGHYRHGGPPGSDTSPARFYGGFLGFKNIEGTLTKKRCVRRNMFFICVQEEFDFPQDIVDAFRFRQENDIIVARSSQQGGLEGINFPNVIHSGPSW